MAAIKIKRTSEWEGKIRDFKIFIDGNFVGKIADEETKEFPTTTGQHTVKAKMGWYSSPDIFIDIGADGIKHLIVGFSKYNKIMYYFTMAIMFIFPILSRKVGFGYANIFLIPIYLLGVYVFVIRHKKYLTLNEKSND